MGRIVGLVVKEEKKPIIKEDKEEKETKKENK
jgi:hypothetical protein